MRKRLNSKEVGRRRFIQSAVAVTSGLSTVGISSAKGKPEDNGSDEVGITNAVSTFLKRGDFEKAERLLDKHDIEYYVSKKNTNAGSVGPQMTWDPDASYVSLYVYNNHDNVYTATGGIWLKGTDHSWRYTSKADDAMGLTYYNNDGAPVDPDPNKLEYDVSYFEGDNAGAPDLKEADYDPNSGVGIKVDVPSEATVGYKTRLYVETQLEDRTSSSTDAVPVLFEYQQNSAYSETFAGVSISVGGLGITVDLDNANREWDDSVTAGPGEYDDTY